MSKVLRRLNDEGIRLFGEYLASGAQGKPPHHLLTEPETSEPIQKIIILSSQAFADRYEFGQYLVKTLAPLDGVTIPSDRYLWSWLALLWLDQLCPQRADGSRDVKEEHRYIYANDFRYYYRHLVRSPWYVVRQHGENGRFLLTATKPSDHPLSVHGEILEQIGGRQQVFGSRPIVAAASRMYTDPATGRPRRGVAGRGRGSAFRFGMVLRQLDLTYDPEVMPESALLGILPKEFSHWGEPPKQAATSDNTSQRAVVQASI
jgi:hypothetical protein